MSINLSDVRQLADPQRQYNSELVIPDFVGSGDGTALRIAVTTSSIPGIGNTAFESNHAGHTVKHAGRRVHPRTLTVEFEEHGALVVLTAFKSWLDLQWDRETGAQAPAETYKTEGLLRMLGMDKSVTKTIKIFGMWVEDVADIPLDGAADDSVKVSVTFSYDDWDLE